MLLIHTKQKNSHLESITPLKPKKECRKNCSPKKIIKIHHYHIYLHGKNTLTTTLKSILNPKIKTKKFSFKCGYQISFNFKYKTY